MATSYSPSIVRNGLALYLDSENSRSYIGSGTNFTDLSNNNLTTTISGSPTFNNSTPKNFIFPGTTGQGISFTNPVNFNSNWTIEMWIKPTSSTWNWFLNMNGYNGITLTLFNLVPRWNYGTWFTEAVTGTLPTLVANQNYQLVFQKSGTNTLTYVNGQQVGNTTSISGQSVSNSTVTIAKGPNITDLYSGTFYCCLMYDTVLTPSQILQNYNSLKGRYGL